MKIVALLLSSGLAVAAPVGATAVIDRPAAIVNGAIVWKSDLEARRMTPESPPEDVVLDQLIDEKLIVEAARDARIEIDDRDIDAAMTEIKTTNNLDDKQFAEVLGKQGYTVAGYRLDLRDQLMRLRFVNQILAPRVLVSDAEVERALEERKLPSNDANRQAARSQLRRAAMDAETTKWFADARKHARIVKRIGK